MKVAIVTTPRSGSTWLYRVLANFFLSNNPFALCLDEYFNVEQIPHCFVPVEGETPGDKDFVFQSLSESNAPEKSFLLDYRENGTFIELFYKPYTTLDETRFNELRQNEKNWKAFLSSESKKRLQRLLECRNKNVVIKIMASDLLYNPDLCRELSLTYRLVFLKREKSEEQLFSYCFSHATGIWSTSVPDDLIPNFQFTAPRTWVEAFYLQKTLYIQSVRDSLKYSPWPEISYEELRTLGGAIPILNRLGVHRNIKPGAFENSRLKAGRVDHSVYFSNRDEVLQWFADLQGPQTRETTQKSSLLELNPV